MSRYQLDTGWRRLARIAFDVVIALWLGGSLATGLATGVMPIDTRNGSSEIAFADSPGWFVGFSVFFVAAIAWLVYDAWRSWRG